MSSSAAPVRTATPTHTEAENVWLSLRAAMSLSRREIVRFLRQRNRVVGAVGQPILFWLLFGAGMNQTFQLPGSQFRDYFIPGTLVLILLFTAIFATISIIEDRQEGFLQAVLVAPVPRWAVVAGKVLGGSILAIGQGLLFFIFALLFGMRPSITASIEAWGLMSVLALGLTSLGFCIAWKLDSTQGFHAIMNLLLMPMWLLSGAFFPIPSLGSGATVGETALHWVMRCNPVTYAVSGLQQLLTPMQLSVDPETTDFVRWMPSMTTCWMVTIGFTLLAFGRATWIARRPAQGDLR